MKNEEEIKAFSIRQWQQEYQNNENWRTRFDFKYEAVEAGWSDSAWWEYTEANISCRTKAIAPLINRIKDGGKLDLDYTHISIEEQDGGDVILFHDGEKNVSMCASKFKGGWAWSISVGRTRMVKMFNNVYQLAKWLNQPFSDEEVEELLSNIEKNRKWDKNCGFDHIPVNGNVLKEALKNSAAVKPDSLAGTIIRTIEAGVDVEDVFA